MKKPNSVVRWQAGIAAANVCQTTELLQIQTTPALVIMHKTYHTTNFSNNTLYIHIMGNSTNPPPPHPNKNCNAKVNGNLIGGSPEELKKN